VTAFAIRAKQIIVSADPLRSAQVMIVEDGQVRDIGDHIGLAAGCETIDLGPRTVVPGFIDAHAHFAVAAFRSLWTDLRTVDDWRSIDLQATGWIRARQPPHWGQHPSLADLDRLAPDRAVIIVESGYHGCALNSFARDLLRRGPAGPRFESIMRTPSPQAGATLNAQPPSETRAPAGSSAVFEGAMGIAETASRNWFQDNCPAEVAAGLAHAATESLAAGVTYICDAAVTPDLEDLLAAGVSSGSIKAGLQLLEVGSHGFFEPPTERIRKSAPCLLARDQKRTVKLFVDGGRHCYVKGTASRARGWRYYDVRALQAMVRAVFEADCNVALHTMGDAAITQAMAATSRLQRVFPDGRVRLEHAPLTTARARRELGATGAHVVVSPHWVEWLGDRWLRAPHGGIDFLALNSLLTEGVVLAAGSDSTDGELTTPLTGMRAAVARRTRRGTILDPAESLTPGQALGLYTQGAAEVCGVTGDRGRLLPGMRADFSVLTRNPLAVQDLFAHDMAVEATWVGGRREYHRDSESATMVPAAPQHKAGASGQQRRYLQ
jgi:predicted amidohydrolase YtcJ